LEAVEKVRAREDAGERAADALLEAARGNAVPIVGEELREIGLVDRPAIGPRRELGDDLLGAEVRVRALARMTREDALAARRRAQPRRIERTADLERAHPIHAILAAARHEHLRVIV